MAAFATPAQDHGIAALEAERGCVRADIRATFVDHADHADGHGDAFDLQAIGPIERGERAAHGIGQFGNFLQRLCHAFDPLFVETKAVDEAVGLLARDTGDIAVVRLDQFGTRAAEGLGGFAQGCVLRIGAGGYETARSLAGALA